MAIVRWDPSRELSSLHAEINRLFSSFFETPGATGAAGRGDGNGSSLRRWYPAMDLVETEDHFVLRADLPGIPEEDVKLELEDNVLTVAGDRKAEHEAKGEGFYRVERATGTFSRSLTLPEGIDPEGVRASFDRGVLEVRIPKPEERKPRRIQIGADQSTIEGSAA